MFKNDGNPEPPSDQVKNGTKCEDCDNVYHVDDIHLYSTDLHEFEAYLCETCLEEYEYDETTDVYRAKEQ